MQKAATERQVASPRAGRDAEETPNTIRKQPRLSPRSPPAVCVEGPETHMGAVVSVPDVARNSAGRFKLGIQMPQPAMDLVDLFVEADVATGSKLKVSVT